MNDEQQGAASAALVLNEYPPNIEEIRETFDLKGNEVFAYAPHIYNPSGGPLTPALIAHEKVHIEQQGDDAAAWWKTYLLDPGFRMNQEIAAHQEEWRVYRRQGHRHHKRSKMLQYIVSRLMTLYGFDLSPSEAKSMVLGVA